jgi:tRNA pseudouridine55 synthase
MDGIVNINKSSGDTSFTVVAVVRKLCKERRVGHGGTLDPLATGVLPVCIGRATRVTEYLMEHPKTYRAEVEFGLTSDSGDADGTIVRGGDVSFLTIEAIRSALVGFRGQTQQVPPMFSALKRNGRPLYELARAGITVERAARAIEIYSLDLVSWITPIATIEVTCSRGTYIRSLASDLGQALGCGAYLRNLCRLKYGPFDLSGSVSLVQLKEMVRDGEWTRVLHPVDSVLSHLPSLSLPADVAEFVLHGRSFAPCALGEVPDALAGIQGQARCRAYTLDGSFVGVLRFNTEKDEWQPDKVFL